MTLNIFGQKPTQKARDIVQIGKYQEGINCRASFIIRMHVREDFSQNQENQECHFICIYFYNGINES